MSAADQFNQVQRRTELWNLLQLMAKEWWTYPMFKEERLHMAATLSGLCGAGG